MPVDPVSQTGPNKTATLKFAAKFAAFHKVV